MEASGEALAAVLGELGEEKGGSAGSGEEEEVGVRGRGAMLGGEGGRGSRWRGPAEEERDRGEAGDDMGR